MKLFLTMSLLIFSSIALADATNFSEQLTPEQTQQILRDYTVPTPEQILQTGFTLQKIALGIMEQKHVIGCANQKAPIEQEKPVDLKKDCVICAIINAENDKEFQLLIGKVSVEDDLKGVSLFSPNKISISLTQANDQVLNGAMDDHYPMGDDLNGHTFGSKFNLTADYDWGSLSLDTGTDLYVSTYDVDVGGRRGHYVTNKDHYKYLQEADEHSFIRLNIKHYLDSNHNRNAGGYNSPFVNFGVGYEHDSDQGIGAFGGIAEREWWHGINGVVKNQYLNHFEDQSTVSALGKVGVERYKPVGKMGICSVVQAGLSGNSSGHIAAEGSVKASIDSGLIGGHSRENPLFTINFEAGFSKPLAAGSDPVYQTDSIYNSANVKNKNYSLIGNVQSSYTSIGFETGGEHLRFSLDAVYEKNQWNDGDTIFMATLKRKF